VGWGLRDWDSGTWGHGDAGSQGCGEVGNRGRGTQGRQDLGTRGDSRAWDVRTGGHDKQTTPGFCAEFVKYNSRRSSER